MVVLDLTAPRHGAEFVADKINQAIFELKMKGFQIEAPTGKQMRTAILVGVYAYFLIHGLETSAFAATAGAAAPPTVEARIINAFKPLIRAMQALGYPLTYLIETFGVLTMFFSRNKGIKIMRDGAVAYFILQFLPTVMDLLTGVGTGISGK